MCNVISHCLSHCPGIDRKLVLNCWLCTCICNIRFFLYSWIYTWDIHYGNSGELLRQWSLFLHTDIQNVSRALPLALVFGNRHTYIVAICQEFMWSHRCSLSSLRWKTYNIMNNRVVSGINAWFDSGSYITCLINVPHEYIYPADEIRHKETPHLVLGRVLKLILKLFWFWNDGTLLGKRLQYINDAKRC